MFRQIDEESIEQGSLAVTRKEPFRRQKVHAAIVVNDAIGEHLGVRVQDLQKHFGIEQAPIILANSVTPALRVKLTEHGFVFGQ